MSWTEEMLAVLQCGDSFELVAPHCERGEQAPVKQEMTCEARVAMQLKCKRIVDIAELNPSLILSLNCAQLAIRQFSGYTQIA